MSTHQVKQVRRIPPQGMTPETFVARCTCGWESKPLASDEAARAAHTHHSTDGR